MQDIGIMVYSEPTVVYSAGQMGLVPRCRSLIDFCDDINELTEQETWQI